MRSILIRYLLLLPIAVLSTQTDSLGADFLIDDFANGNLDAGVVGTAGRGTAPFLYISEKNGWLDLTYNQPDGHSDIAWWQALSWSWSTVDVSAYSYMCMDISGVEGGEDFKVEFHYKDLAGKTQKPQVRISDYGAITNQVRTVNIPIEDFQGFMKSRAFAMALGFRYPTPDQDSITIDNIRLSARPTEFFHTHSAESVASNAALFVFKPHFPTNAGPCSSVTMQYQINSGTTSGVSMVSTDAYWRATLTPLTNRTAVSYWFIYSCPAASTSATYAFQHNAVIDHVPPSAPSGLDGSAVSPSRIDLRWTASTDNVAVIGYRIYRNDVEIGESATTNYSAIGLTQNTTYSFYIRAIDGFGNLSTESDSRDITTLTDTVPPSKPTQLNGTATGSTTASLTWNASTDNVAVVGYHVQRDGQYVGSTTRTNMIASGIPGSNHSFAVQAYDNAGNLSATSDAVLISMPTDITPPTAPATLSATAIGPNQIHLSWSPSTDDGTVAAYEIFRNGSLIDTTPVTNYDAFGLAPTTTYEFAVRAVDSVGLRSGYSPSAWATTLSGSAPQLGSYASSIPAGFATPPTVVYATTNVTPPLPTSDWWSSILHVRCSGLLAARPLCFYAKGWALEFSYPTVTTPDPYKINALFTKQMEISATGGSFPARPAGESRVDGYGDSSVRVRIGNDTSHITATLVHGSPYAYTEFNNCSPIIRFPSAYTVESVDTNVSLLLVRVSTGFISHFALFAPSGTTWNTANSTQIVASLPPGSGYMSAAVLTSRSTSYSSSELDILKNHAFAFVTNTVVEFAFQRTNSMVVARHRAQTRVMQGTETETLSGLLPHHWMNSTDATVAGMQYSTLLGGLKLKEASEFTTRIRFAGIVPQFPEPGDATWSKVMFATLAEQIGDIDNAKSDTYWHSKDIQRLARVIPALDAAGLVAKRDDLLDNLEDALTDMFTYTPNETAHFFAYNATWGTLLGFQESYGSVQYLTDHHFHYGMLAYSAAILGLYRPAFVASYGAIVDKVIREFNNPSKDFSGQHPLPWLRCFDPWEGHCWATGLGGTPVSGSASELLYTGEKNMTVAEGPDQESTSEAMNAWAGMFLWGLASGQEEFLNMGAIGYATEAEAIRHYWYDATQTNHPGGYAPTMISRLFGGKMDPLTWFGTEMYKAWGIQYITTGPHMTYQGYFKPYRITDYDYFRGNSWEDIPDGWKDVHWMYRCFFEPSAVLAEYTSETPVDDGNTKANLYYWLHAMNTLGEVNTNVYSDNPAMIAMTYGGTTNFIGFNFTGGPLTARVFRCSDDAPLGHVLLRNQRSTAFASDGDEDQDGLGNATEMALGTELFRADTDEDGQEDPDEVFTGTDPIDPASYFASYLLAPEGTTTLSMVWAGITGRYYDVRAYPSLASAQAGMNASNLLVNATGTGVVVRSVTLPAWDNGFLRLIAK